MQSIVKIWNLLWDIVILVWMIAFVLRTIVFIIDGVIGIAKKFIQRRKDNTEPTNETSV